MSERNAEEVTCILSQNWKYFSLTSSNTALMEEGREGRDLFDRGQRRRTNERERLRPMRQQHQSVRRSEALKMKGGLSPPLVDLSLSLLLGRSASLSLHSHLMSLPGVIWRQTDSRLSVVGRCDKIRNAAFVSYITSNSALNNIALGSRGRMDGVW